MERAEYEREVCGRLGQAETVPFEPVAIGDWRPEVAKCHANVDVWVHAHPSHTAVRGWTTCADLGVAVRLVAHSVVQDRTGRLFDITPFENEGYRRGMRFVPHRGDDVAFFAHEEQNRSIDCPCGQGFA